MKVTITVRKEVEVKTLHLEAGVRYWEDTVINGEPDTENGEIIPCKEGKLWKPVIELETGKILNWQQGIKADVHYKVCDNGSYFVKDAEGNTILSIEQGYVPSILFPKKSGYGDYILLDIDENGFIQDWKADLSDFISED
jgi:hypothetical protein